MNPEIKKEKIIYSVASVIAIMLFYAAFSKLIDYDKSRQEMLNQIFPASIALVLTWLVPVTELCITCLLLYKPLRLLGFYASAILLSAFSLYISITMTGVFGRIPCSCGGILNHMSYWTHLAFNFIFIVMAVLGISLEKQWKPVNRWFDFLNAKGGASKFE